jgi:hypothetical protein
MLNGLFLKASGLQVDNVWLSFVITRIKLVIWLCIHYYAPTFEIFLLVSFVILSLNRQSGENLVILTGRPDCSLVVFRWQKGKAEYCASLAAADASLSNPALGSSVAPTTYDLFHTLALNPLDAETCCVLGPHGLRFYRLTDDQALLVRGVTDQLTNRPQSAANVLAAASSMVSGGGGGMFTASGRVEVTCAAWLREPADTALVGASDGRLALYTAGVFQCFLPPCMANGVAVTSLVSLACGVVVGGSDGGLRFLKLALPELGESPEVRGRGSVFLCVYFDFISAACFLVF